MELPCRSEGDRLLKPGQLTDIRRRLHNIASQHDLTSVIACAYDPRTRMLPFYQTAAHMVPAGVRAIGAALVESGFEKTRIVLQQWNRRFKPSTMKLDGRTPDMFLLSSMQIHAAAADGLLRDVCRIAPDDRPLVICGGPRAIYEPWNFFSSDPKDAWQADVVVTGEEYVLLEMLEVVLSVRSPGESMRSAFLKAKHQGLLNEIPGLVYPVGDGPVPDQLIDTGIQRLVADLDELPSAVTGFKLLEKPSRFRKGLSGTLPANRVRFHSPVASMVLTLGCKMGCPYCPIPAYNQRVHRLKSGERIAEEMGGLYEQFGIRFAFGADDNLLNDKDRALDLCETLSRAQIAGKPLRKRIRWGSEATIHGVLEMKDYLWAVRKAGVIALWVGVEDMTGTLVKKGQSVDKTRKAFALLHEVGISPMAMMMHHDTQPLFTRGQPYGLLNQVQLLRKYGAVDFQVLMISPATGSRIYEETFTSGMVYDRVGGKKVQPYMYDGNYVVASKADKPWQKQLNLSLAYMYFFNPVRFLISLFRPKSRQKTIDPALQIGGMWSMIWSYPRTFLHAARLATGRISRREAPPSSGIPMSDPEGRPACHALPGTPVADGLQDSQSDRAAE
ncbi:MAG: B12-binding domain-containing radical SAM protein [Phycisphaerae bacterium]